MFDVDAKSLEEAGACPSLVVIERRATVASPAFNKPHRDARWGEKITAVWCLADRPMKRGMVG